MDRKPPRPRTPVPYSVKPEKQLMRFKGRSTSGDASTKDQIKAKPRCSSAGPYKKNRIEPNDSPTEAKVSFVSDVNKAYTDILSRYYKQLKNVSNSREVNNKTKRSALLENFIEELNRFLLRILPFVKTDPEMIRLEASTSFHIEDFVINQCHEATLKFKEFENLLTEMKLNDLDIKDIFETINKHKRTECDLGVSEVKTRASNNNEKKGKVSFKDENETKVCSNDAKKDDIDRMNNILRDLDTLKNIACDIDKMKDMASSLEGIKSMAVGLEQGKETACDIDGLKSMALEIFEAKDMARDLADEKDITASREDNVVSSIDVETDITVRVNEAWIDRHKPTTVGTKDMACGMSDGVKDVACGMSDTSCSFGVVNDIACGMSDTSCTINGVNDVACGISEMKDMACSMSETSCAFGGVTDMACGIDGVNDTACGVDGETDLACIIGGVTDMACGIDGVNDMSCGMSGSCGMNEVNDMACGIDGETHMSYGNGGLADMACGHDRGKDMACGLSDVETDVVLPSIGGGEYRSRWVDGVTAMACRMDGMEAMACGLDGEHNLVGGGVQGVKDASRSIDGLKKVACGIIGGMKDMVFGADGMKDFPCAIEGDRVEVPAHGVNGARHTTRDSYSVVRPHEHGLVTSCASPERSQVTARFDHDTGAAQQDLAASYASPELTPMSHTLTPMSHTLTPMSHPGEQGAAGCGVEGKARRKRSRSRPRYDECKDLAILNLVTMLNDQLQQIRTLGPRHDQCSPIGQVGPHAGQAGPHAGQVGPHVDQAGPHVDQVGPHVDQVGPHANNDSVANNGSSDRHLVQIPKPACVSEKVTEDVSKSIMNESGASMDSEKPPSGIHTVPRHESRTDGFVQGLLKGLLQDYGQTKNKEPEYNSDVSRDIESSIVAKDISTAYQSAISYDETIDGHRDHNVAQSKVHDCERHTPLLTSEKPPTGIRSVSRKESTKDEHVRELLKRLLLEHSKTKNTEKEHYSDVSRDIESSIVGKDMSAAYHMSAAYQSVISDGATEYETREHKPRGMDTTDGQRESRSFVSDLSEKRNVIVKDVNGTCHDVPRCKHVLYKDTSREQCFLDTPKVNIAQTVNSTSPKLPEFTILKTVNAASQKSPTSNIIKPVRANATNISNPNIVKPVKPNSLNISKPNIVKPVKARSDFSPSYETSRASDKLVGSVHDVVENLIKKHNKTTTNETETCYTSKVTQVEGNSLAKDVPESLKRKQSNITNNETEPCSKVKISKVDSSNVLASDMTPTTHQSEDWPTSEQGKDRRLDALLARHYRRQPIRSSVDTFEKYIMEKYNINICDESLNEKMDQTSTNITESEANTVQPSTVSDGFVAHRWDQVPMENDRVTICTEEARNSQLQFYKESNPRANGRPRSVNSNINEILKKYDINIDFEAFAAETRNTTTINEAHLDYIALKQSTAERTLEWDKTKDGEGSSLPSNIKHNSLPSNIKHNDIAQPTHLENVEAADHTNQVTFNAEIKSNMPGVTMQGHSVSADADRNREEHVPADNNRDVDVTAKRSTDNMVPLDSSRKENAPMGTIMEESMRRGITKGNSATKNTSEHLLDRKRNSLRSRSISPRKKPNMYPKITKSSENLLEINRLVSKVSEAHKASSQGHRLDRFSAGDVEKREQHDDHIGLAIQLGTKQSLQHDDHVGLAIHLGTQKNVRIKRCPCLPHATAGATPKEHIACVKSSSSSSSERNNRQQLNSNDIKAHLKLPLFVIPQSKPVADISHRTSKEINVSDNDSGGSFGSDVVKLSKDILLKKLKSKDASPRQRSPIARVGFKSQSHRQYPNTESRGHNTGSKHKDMIDRRRKNTKPSYDNDSDTSDSVHQKGAAPQFPPTKDMLNTNNVRPKPVKEVCVSTAIYEERAFEVKTQTVQDKRGTCCPKCTPHDQHSVGHEQANRAHRDLKKVEPRQKEVDLRADPQDTLFDVSDVSERNLRKLEPAAGNAHQADARNTEQVKVTSLTENQDTLLDVSDTDTTYHSQLLQDASQVKTASLSSPLQNVRSPLSDEDPGVNTQKACTDIDADANEVEADNVKVKYDAKVKVMLSTATETCCLQSTQTNCDVIKSVDVSKQNKRANDSFFGSITQECGVNGKDSVSVPSRETDSKGYRIKEVGSDLIAAASLTANDVMDEWRKLKEYFKR